MAFIPYSRQDIDDEDIAAVVGVLRSEFLTQGPAVVAFEQAFAARHAVAHAVAVTNATAALHLACLALGVGPGSRVWTTPNSFLSSANAPRMCGAEVGFVDIDPATRNMSVADLAERLERAASRGELPQVIIPVDFSGLPADLREMHALARRHGIAILEDASHATGAEYLGRPVGSAWADCSVFSFHAVKVVTTGEGGMVTTQDPALARRVALLRSHGMTREAQAMTHTPEGPWVYEQHALGFNDRLTDVQAALGLSQLRRLDAMQARREALAARYDRLLGSLPLKLPPRLADRRSAWHLYAVEIDRARCDVPRARVFAALRDAGIGVNVHYIPIHTQPYWRELGWRAGDFPHAEAYYGSALSLPLFPALREDEQDRVVEVLTAALAG